MSRTDQYIGLTERAKKFLKENALHEHLEVKCPHCNKVISSHDSIDIRPGKFHWAGFDSPNCTHSFLDNDNENEYREDDCRECQNGEKCYHRLPGYELKDGRLIFEKIQTEPWSSGPMFFIHLVDDNDNPIDGTSWTDEEIEEYI